MKAHDFDLQDGESIRHTLGDYRGRWLVLYFYPKDDTSGCTKEACGFRDNLSALAEQGVAVLGVSRDSADSHRQFAEKYKLDFPLLSDESAATIKAYGAWGPKISNGQETVGILRNTYLIDPSGDIRKVYERVAEPEAHARQILHDLQELRANE